MALLGMDLALSRQQVGPRLIWTLGRHHVSHGASCFRLPAASRIDTLDESAGRDALG
jgi:hypothetical protein